MKKYYYLILASMLCFQLYGQETKFGVKSGLNLSVINNTINTGADIMPGPHFGVYLETKLGKSFAIQPELLYSFQGCKTHFFNGEANGSINLNYVNLGILMKLYVFKGFHVTVGPQVGFLVSAKEYYKVSASGTKAKIDVKDSYKSFDAALSTGIGYHFNNGFNIGLRYNPGIANINANEQKETIRNLSGIGKLTNRVVQASIGYNF